MTQYHCNDHSMMERRGDSGITCEGLSLNITKVLLLLFAEHNCLLCEGGSTPRSHYLLNKPWSVWVFSFQLCWKFIKYKKTLTVTLFLDKIEKSARLILDILFDARLTLESDNKHSGASGNVQRKSCDFENKNYTLPLSLLLKLFIIA